MDNFTRNVHSCFSKTIRHFSQKFPSFASNPARIRAETGTSFRSDSHFVLSECQIFEKIEIYREICTQFGWFSRMWKVLRNKNSNTFLTRLLHGNITEKEPPQKQEETDAKTKRKDCTNRKPARSSKRAPAKAEISPKTKAAVSSHKENKTKKALSHRQSKSKQRQTEFDGVHSSF